MYLKNVKTIHTNQVHSNIKCKSKERNFGNLQGVQTLNNLVNRLSNDVDSLTFHLYNQQHKIETVLLNEKRKNKCSVLFYEKNFIYKYKKITKLYIDKTYRTKLRPNHYYARFLTILAEIESKVNCYFISNCNKKKFTVL